MIGRCEGRLRRTVTCLTQGFRSPIRLLLAMHNALRLVRQECKLQPLLSPGATDWARESATSGRSHAGPPVGPPVRNTKNRRPPRIKPLEVCGNAGGITRRTGLASYFSFSVVVVVVEFALTGLRAVFSSVVVVVLCVDCSRLVDEQAVSDTKATAARHGRMSFFISRTIPWIVASPWSWSWWFSSPQPPEWTERLSPSFSR